MKVTYKYLEPEIVIKPKVYAIFNYIAKNIKTNLIWLCLVRKSSNTYIVEDVYFPPQNVNEWMMCNFDEEYLSRVTASTFRNDFRDCQFNMIGKYVKDKKVEIDSTVFKEFDKIAHPNLDECVMMQLNNSMEMTFTISRRATILSDIGYTVDMSGLIDTGDLQLILDSKIGHYTKDYDSGSGIPKINVKENDKKEEDYKPVSVLLMSDINWRSVV